MLDMVNIRKVNTIFRVSYANRQQLPASEMRNIYGSGDAKFFTWLIHSRKERTHNPGATKTLNSLPYVSMMTAKASTVLWPSQEISTSFPKREEQEEKSKCLKISLLVTFQFKIYLLLASLTWLIWDYFIPCCLSLLRTEIV